MKWVTFASCGGFDLELLFSKHIVICTLTGNYPLNLFSVKRISIPFVIDAHGCKVAASKVIRMGENSKHICL